MSKKIKKPKMVQDSHVVYPTDRKWMIKPGRCCLDPANYRVIARGNKCRICGVVWYALPHLDGDYK